MPIWPKQFLPTMYRAYHEPVLLQEAVDGLQIKPNGVYVDVTLGGGGHAREILKRLGTGGRLIAFDQDQDALAHTIDDERFQWIPQNFRHLKSYLRFHGLLEVDGVLADLGVSSHQFDTAARGFSIRFDADLDMRMNQGAALSACQLVNTYTQEALAKVLFQYGELRQANRMAKAIVQARAEAPIKTTGQLKAVLHPVLPKRKEHKTLARVYQALRIEVNQEMEALKELLCQVPEVLVKGGRLSIISYHSLEDRLAKRFIRSGQFEGEPEKDFYGHIAVPLKKVGGLIIPSVAEVVRNTRARSAKLRIAERI